VPIKGEAATSVDIDPLVMQTYKTTVCFFTSWFVLLVPGETLCFTPWGICSGIFWVPAGISAVYAIRNAGLALSQGIWSSIIVIVSFVWGIFVFGEDVRSKIGACIAILLMIIGLWGMSYYSTPSRTTLGNTVDNFDTNQINGHTKNGDASERKLASRPEPTQDNNYSEAMYITLHANEDDQSDEDHALRLMNASKKQALHLNGNKVIFCGVMVNRRNLGIMCAIFSGLWGGSIMAPMHYATEKTNGISYTISFAIGAAIITSLIWLLRYFYYFYQERKVLKAYNRLPSFHFKTMWLPGGAAGLLWSIGNLGSIISVDSLGEGVGYPLVQASMLISGIWGIFWYKEVDSYCKIVMWLMSAVSTLIGLIWLSFEHAA